jgi:hypothetical protein
VSSLRWVDETWDGRLVHAIREALWANDSIREAFLAENPAGLSRADLTLVESWRDRVPGAKQKGTSPLS